MKQALLIASFGTTVPRAEQEAAALERALAAAAPGWTAVRAYTSGLVRRALARQGRPVDSPAEALAKLHAGRAEGGARGLKSPLAAAKAAAPHAAGFSLMPPFNGVGLMERLIAALRRELALCPPCNPRPAAPFARMRRI